jgi:hypothetical protein
LVTFKSSESWSFDDFVVLLRVRLRDADAVEPVRIHSFMELMADRAEESPDQWYWQAFEELEAQGHLDRASSHKAFGGDAFGRLSADGRLFLREAEQQDG